MGGGGATAWTGKTAVFGFLCALLGLYCGSLLKTDSRLTKDRDGDKGAKNGEGAELAYIRLPLEDCAES